MVYNKAEKSKSVSVTLRIFLVLSCFLMSINIVSAQKLGVKTNLLYWATTTPNVGAEMAIAHKSTISLDLGYNPFKFPQRTMSTGEKINPKLLHFSVMPEYKYWFCEAFEGHNIGIHGIFLDYNIGGISFINALDKYRYEGQGYGLGVSYGYQWAIGGKWGFELSLGAGYIYFDDKKYDCYACGDYLGHFKRNYFGLTKASVTFIYYLK